MKATSLIKAVEQRGGQAKLVGQDVHRFNGCHDTVYHVEGTLNGYDIHMIGDEQDFFTVRPVSKHVYFDAGSDYNSGGYTFCNRIKDLDWSVR